MSKRYGVVYRITCRVNGKVYHGQTVNPETRWPKHFSASSHCHALRNAIRKYGRGNFDFEVVATASSKEELDALEIRFVATSLAPVGYNLKEGGANGRPSEETRRKLSAAGKIAQNRPKVRAQNSAGVRAAMARPEVKKKHRAALKRHANSPEGRAARREQMLEVHSRPEEQRKRSNALKDSWRSLTEKERTKRIVAQKAGYTEEVRDRIGRTSKDRMNRPETKEKHRKAVADSCTPARRTQMSLRMKEVHARPGESERRGAAISKAHNTPEGKKKLAMRRRRGESEDVWRARIQPMLDEEGPV